MPAPIIQLLAPQGPVVSAVCNRFPNALAMYAFGSQIQGTAGSQSDLDLRVASTAMQYQVITTGQRLWSTGLTAGLFERFALSEKTSLDEARAPLLAHDILNVQRPCEAVLDMGQHLVLQRG
jgi:hypothetical protein